jgi:hypothetical protein
MLNHPSPFPRAATLCALLALTPALSLAQEIEIIRGTEKSTHSVDAGSIGTRGPSVDLETRRYSMTPGDRQRIRAAVDEVLRIYRDVLGVKVPWDFDIDLVVQGDARKFRRQTNNRPIGGFYSHSEREAVVSGRAGRAQVRIIAVHESSHAILMDRAPHVPAWLNEGLAEYFSLIEVEDGGARIPAQYERLDALEEVRGGGGWPLEEFFAISDSQWASLDIERLQLAYTQAWSLAYFFMSSDSGKEELRKLIAEFDEPGNELRSAKLLDRIHPGGIKALEKQWRSWLRRSRSPHRY